MARKKHGTKPMTIREIADASGCSKSWIADISMRTTWSGLHVDMIDRFAAACGVDLFRPWDIVEQFKFYKLTHLKRAKGVQRSTLLKIMSIRPGQPTSQYGQTDRRQPPLRH